MIFPLLSRITFHSSFHNRLADAQEESFIEVGTEELEADGQARRVGVLTDGDREAGQPGEIGLPVGLQLLGPHFDEALLLRIGQAIMK